MTNPARPVPPLTQAEAEVLNGLDTALRSVALRHRADAIAAGYPFHFLSGLRSRSQQLAEQNRPGRTTPAAPPGHSKHEVGGAYDLERQAPSVENAVGAIGERLGLRWGGRFKNALGQPDPDPNHFEAPVSRAELVTYRNLALVTAAGILGVGLVIAAER